MDATLLIILENIILIIFWPWFSSLRGNLRNSALRRDNPYMKKCYLMRRWVTPALFVTFSFPVFFVVQYFETDWIEEVMISVLILFVAILTGSLISELFVDYFKRNSY
jgi:hypothetical protein